MKKLNVSFEGVQDTTGYLFSLTKCLSAALRHGGYEEYAEDIVATSGFAFRTWAAADLCPSAMSIWEFKKQKTWVENGGLVCHYVERMWGEDALEKERREEAVRLIQESIDRDVAAVAWDISDAEWGIITGYDEETKIFYTLKIDGNESQVPYDKLGLLNLPILSVLTVAGSKAKDSKQLMADTKTLITAHLREEEWCDNAQGIAAYDTIIAFIQDKLNPEVLWNLEYYLGTYAALRFYGWKFFEKYQETKLAALYETVYFSWQKAFELKRNADVTDTKIKMQLISLLQQAKEAEMEVSKMLQ